MTCPECGTRMRYDFAEGGIRCPQCGHSPLEAQRERTLQNPREHVSIGHTGPVNPNAISAFRTAHDYLHRGDQPRAIEALHRALAFQKDFTDAHLWIAKLVHDEKTKRKHLSVILAYDPGNVDALREMMVLNGQLTREEADRTHHHEDQQIKHLDAPVTTESEALLCPVCGGHMTVHEASGTVECAFCGHSEPHKSQSAVGAGTSLAMALLKRKAQPVRWVVGSRLLVCQECGSERTIPARKLSDECPFCGSTHVIRQDAAGSFEQPEGLVQFRINQRAASEAIEEELGSLRHRIAGLFNNNRIKHMVIEGVYLPFWMFDVLSQISITRRIRNTSKYGRMSNIQPVTREEFTDGLYDVPICGVVPPDRGLTTKLGRYNLDRVLPYEARLLARIPAQLYNVDFDKASLEVRSVASKIFEEKHKPIEFHTEDDVEITVSSMIKQMSFRLLLLPVWVATLTEEDGDTRTALVNGQHGKVVLGRTTKAR
jgi:uncharacterized Zn finger protein (UPF0148 family)